MKRILTAFALLLSSLGLFAQGVTIEFQLNATPSPFNDPEQFYGNIVICNNSGATLAGGFEFDLRMPSLVSMSGLNATQNGTAECDTWTISTNSWNNINNGACLSLSVNGEYNPPLLYPPYALTSAGDTIRTVVTDPQFIPASDNVNPWQYNFNPDCFIPSPPSLCLGQAQIAEWSGGSNLDLADVKVPSNRIGWAIAAAHVHRMFNNMVGAEITSIDYVFAQSMIEGRMGCDAGIVPPAVDDNPLDYRAGSVAAGCFQILPTGWAQLNQFYPDLYGSLSYANIISGDNFITAALSKALYDMTTFTYYEKVNCTDPIGFFDQSADPYIAEEVLAYSYHEGLGGSGAGLTELFVTNRATLINEPDVAEYFSSTRSDAGIPYMERMRNNMIQLENNFGVPGGTAVLTSDAQNNWQPFTAAIPPYNEYHGCYDEPVSWADFDAYIDEAYRLFWTADVADVKSRVQAAFNAINGGGPINFSQLGAVIDTMVIAFPAYSPDQGMAETYFANLCGSPAAALSSCDVICPGEEGELWVHLMGTPPFTYTVQGPTGTLYTKTGVTVATDFLKVTEPGTYQLINIEDATGTVFLNCHSSSATIENAGAATAEWNKASVSNGCASGNLELSLTGAGPWDIYYTKDGAPETMITVPAGSAMPYAVPAESPATGNQYILTRMVAGGCDSQLNDTINFCTDCTKPPYSILTPDTAICQGDTAQVRISFNGTAPYTLYFTPGALPQVSVPNINDDFYVIPVSVAGTVTIDSLVDATCTNDTAKSLTITVNSLPVVALGNDTSLCGTELTLDAGTNNITGYEWMENAANNGQTFVANTAGANEYRVEVTSGDGCVARDSINVTLNTPPVAPNIPDTAICAVSTPYTLDATGAFDSYEWSDGSTNPTLDVSATGDYWVAVTVNGCSDTDSVAVTVSPGQALELGNDTSICGASFVLDARPGFATYMWNGNAADNGQTLTVNTSGQYYVDVTTSDGCSSSDSINITIGTIPTVNLGVDTSYCEPDVPVTYDATTAGATYEWNDGSTNPTLDINVTGNYWVIVDVNGCSDTDTVSIVVNSSPILDLGTDTTICGDSITFDVGAGFASYSWNQSAVDTNQTYTASVTGQYIIETVTMAGCSGSDTINVTINPYPTAQISPTDPSDTVRACATSFPVTLDATQAGGTYEWNDASTNPTLDAAAQGDFWVIVTVNGCSDTDSVVVQQSTSLSLDLGPDTTICPGQSYTLRPNVTYSGVTFDWNNGASTDDSLVVSTAGEVTLQISANGCFGNDTMELFIDNPLSIALTDGSACEGDSVKLELSPARVGLNYAWNIGGGTISTDSVVHGSTLGTTTYTLDVDSAGCTASATADVTINALPTVNLGADTFLCVGAGATITLDAGAGMTTYTWQDGSGAQTLVASDSGTYHVTVLDANTCSSADTIRVDHQLATAFELGQDTTICPAGTATINLPTGLGGAGTSYVWEDGSSTAPYTISGQADGYSELVTLTYTNAFGCVSGDSLTVSVDNTLPVNGLTDTALCEGQSITFLTSYAGQLGYNYLWHDGTTAQNFPMNNVTIGDHQTVISVDITSDEGCSGSASATLTVNANPTPSLPDTTICLNESVVLDQGVTAAGHTFVWTASDNSVLPATATQNINGLSAGAISYTVEVTETATTCVGNASGSVTVNNLPFVNLGNDITACLGETVAIPSSGSLYPTVTHSYIWSRNGIVIPGATNNAYATTVDGTFEVVVTELSSNCQATDELQVTLTPSPVIDIQIADSTICIGESAVMEASVLSGNLDYSWFIGEQLSTATPISQNEQERIMVSDSGLYHLVVTNLDAGCSDTASHTLSVNQLPVSGLINDTIVCFEDMLNGVMVLDAGPVRHSYLWSNGDTTQTIEINERGTYTVTITDDQGCASSDEVEVQVDCQANIWIANSFTPDGNGLNETWTVAGRGIESIEMFIFNRWGELIWQGDDMHDPWDGTVNGNPVAIDTYVYKVTYGYLDVSGGERYRTKVGTLTLVR